MQPRSPFDEIHGLFRNGPKATLELDGWGENRGDLRSAWNVEGELGEAARHSSKTNRPSGSVRVSRDPSRSNTSTRNPSPGAASRPPALFRTAAE